MQVEPTLSSLTGAWMEHRTAIETNGGRFDIREEDSKYGDSKHF